MVGSPSHAARVGTHFAVRIHLPARSGTFGLPQATLRRPPFASRAARPAPARVRHGSRYGTGQWARYRARYRTTEAARLGPRPAARSCDRRRRADRDRRDPDHRAHIGDDPSTTADPSTSAASPTTTAELPAGGILDGAGGSSSGEEAGPAAADDEAALRELIPLDFNASSCTATGRPAGDGSRAALTCGASISSPGANASDFFLYGSGDDLDSAFQSYVEDRSLNELPSSDAAGCGADQGFGDYSQGGPVVGELACFIDTEDTAYLVWTNTELDVFAITSRASGDAAELRALYDWWVSRGQITQR